MPDRKLTPDNTELVLNDDGTVEVKEIVDRRKITPLMFDLMNSVNKHLPDLEAIDVACAITNVLIAFTKKADTQTQTVILHNLGNVLESLAKDYELLLASTPHRVQ